MFVRHPKPPAGFLRRLIAAGAAAVVLALAVLASSAELHGRLHAADQPCGEDGCAVVLFAGGVSLPLEPVAARPPCGAGDLQPAARRAEIFLPKPRYLRQPERGPPAHRVG